MRSWVGLIDGGKRERRAISPIAFVVILVAGALGIVLPPAGAGIEGACGEVNGEVQEDLVVLDAFNVESCEDNFNVSGEEGTAEFEADDGSKVTAIATEQYSATFDASGARFADATGDASVFQRNGSEDQGAEFEGDAQVEFGIEFVVPEGGTGSVFAKVGVTSTGGQEEEGEDVGIGDALAGVGLQGADTNLSAGVEILREEGPETRSDSLVADDLQPGSYSLGALVDLDGDGVLDPDKKGRLTGAFDLTVSVSAPAEACTNEFTDGADEITGTSGNDVLCGGGGGDEIDGGGGNDTIYGGGGNDTLSGGGDDDTIQGGPGEDGIETGFGRDVAHGEGANDVIVGGNEGGCESDTEGDPQVDDGFAGGGGEDVILGCGGSDLILGDDAGDFLSGNHGKDTVFGFDGRDSLFGDDGNDTLFGGEDNDDLFGGPGDEVSFEGSRASPGLNGGSGEDGIDGGPGDDFVSGGDDDDGIDGSSGSDRLEGDGGADRIVGGSRKDVFRGGNGSDTLLSRDGTRDVLHGNGGRDKARVDGRDDVDGVEVFL
jgi:Ca2+-binding RTX toxin-like protein